MYIVGIYIYVYTEISNYYYTSIIHEYYILLLYIFVHSDQQ